MKTKQPQISVATSAYNEENIKELLISIIDQKETIYQIKEIIVINDGSTDQTLNLIKQVRDKRLRIINSKSRKGKSYHLNTIFKLSKGELIVLFDADVTLKSPSTIANLVKPLIKDNEIKLVGGFSEHAKTRNFLEESINVANKHFHRIRRKISGGSNIYTCIGQILCLRKEFAKNIHVPANILCNDSYLYLSCISKGFKFRHVPSAKVIYRSPTKIEDYHKQSIRFNVAKERLAKIFGNLALKEFKIPTTLYLYYGIIAFIKNPIHILAYKFLMIYSIYVKRRFTQNIMGTWPMALSTKVRINYGK